MLENREPLSPPDDRKSPYSSIPRPDGSVSSLHGAATAPQSSPPANQSERFLYKQNLGADVQRKAISNRQRTACDPCSLRKVRVRQRKRRDFTHDQPRSTQFPSANADNVVGTV